MKGINFPHKDAIIISVRICGFRVNHMMIDTVSNADVLFNYAYERMAPKLPKKLKPIAMSLMDSTVNQLGLGA